MLNRRAVTDRLCTIPKQIESMRIPRPVRARAVAFGRWFRTAKEMFCAAKRRAAGPGWAPSSPPPHARRAMPLHAAGERFAVRRRCGPWRSKIAELATNCSVRSLPMSEATSDFGATFFARGARRHALVRLRPTPSPRRKAHRSSPLPAGPQPLGRSRDTGHRSSIGGDSAAFS